MIESMTIEMSVADASRLLQVVSDPARLQVLRDLAGGTRCVCDLQATASVAPNVLSYHLKVLRDAGLVTTTRRGRWIDYHLAPDAGRRLRATLAGLVDGVP